MMFCSISLKEQCALSVGLLFVAAALLAGGVWKEMGLVSSTGIPAEHYTTPSSVSLIEETNTSTDLVSHSILEKCPREGEFVGSINTVTTYRTAVRAGAGSRVHPNADPGSDFPTHQPSFPFLRRQQIAIMTFSVYIGSERKSSDK